MSRSPFVLCSLQAAVAAASLAMTHHAGALGNVGAEAGISQRAVDYTDHLNTGFAFGLHAELDAAPWFKVGPYYLHYELPSSSPSLEPRFLGGAYNVLGIRGSFVVPVSDKLELQFHAGFGRTWLIDHWTTVARETGDFIELPIGIGVSYEVIERLWISFDAAYRRAVLFGGDAFNDDGYHASTGLSFLIGPSLRL
jgi:hypothetical protein